MAQNLQPSVAITARLCQNLAMGTNYLFLGITSPLGGQAVLACLRVVSMLQEERVTLLHIHSHEDSCTGYAGKLGKPGVEVLALKLGAFGSCT